VQRVLVILGILLIVIGLLWPWLSRFPIGRLPGDIIINKPGLKIYIPLSTMIVASIILSFFLWIISKIK